MRYLAAHLGSTNFVAPIRSIYLQRQTGILEVDGPNLRRRLHFISGELHLRRFDLPLNSDRAGLLAQLTSKDRRNGEGLQMFTAMIAERWAAWNATSFQFTDGGVVDEDLVGPLPTARLLLAAAEVAGIDEQIVYQLGGLEAPIVAVPASQTPAADVPIRPEEASLLDLCQQPVKLGDILGKVAGDRDSTLRILSRLWVVGLLRPSADQDALFNAIPSPDLPPEVPLEIPAIEEESSPEAAHSQVRGIWQHHFRLNGDPFSLTPDPAFLFLSEGHAEALAALEVCLLERRGLAVLIGEVGTGKTTLLYSLLNSTGSEIETAYVANTTLSFDEILQAALNDLGVTTASRRRVALLEALNTHLLHCSEMGKTVALVVDEAQALSTEAFEGLRQLLNFETYDRKLLQIFLVGQPELGARLRQLDLRQVADRIAVRCYLEPLRPKEARKYIHHRLEAAGAKSRVLTPSALGLVVRKSKCIPRSINVLCHNAMLFAFAKGLTVVDRSLVKEAVKERTGRRNHRLSLRRLLSPRAWTGVALIFALGLLWVGRTTDLGHGLSAAEPADRISALEKTPELSLPKAAIESFDDSPTPGTTGKVAMSMVKQGVQNSSQRFETRANLNVRSGPSTDDNILVTLPKDTEVVLLVSEGEWSVVRSRNDSGWVKTAYLAPLAERDMGGAS